MRKIHGEGGLSVLACQTPKVRKPLQMQGLGAVEKIRDIEASDVIPNNDVWINDANKVGPSVE